MRVFISYSSKDGKEYAKKLYTILNEHGHDPFLIDHDAFAGQSIWDVIANELNRDLVIFLITPSSSESKGQKQEYDMVVARYGKRMPFFHESAWKVVTQNFPLLEPYKGIVFNESNFEERCEDLAVQLVRLQDREGLIEKREFEEDFFLSQEGLDLNEIEKCIESLNDSFQRETIIPEIANTRVYVEKSSSIKFVFIGFNYRLPREWFIPNSPVALVNDPMFREFGRQIALGEQKYLHDQILGSEKIEAIEVSFSPTGILEAVKRIRDKGFEPNVIFLPMKQWMEMHKWMRKQEAAISYSNIFPRPRLDASLKVDGSTLKIVPPIGDIVKETILISNQSIIWHVKKHQKYGALHITFGNDSLYPKRYVQLLAGTKVNCEVNPQGIRILKFKD